MTYIATFYSHFGAVRFTRLCRDRNWAASMSPVPRNLSSSCGTCVRYDGDDLCPCPEIPEEIEQIVQVTDSGYKPLYRAENS